MNPISTNSHKKYNPIFIGAFALVLTLLCGAGIGFVMTGTPHAVSAAGAPTCTLSVSPAPQGANGDIISWTTSSDTVSLSIDNGVGSVGLSVNGALVNPSVTTTYTGTATDATGATGTCSTTITVAATSAPANPPANPSCQLSVASDSIHSGDTTQLTWSTNRTDSADTTLTIDNGIGGVDITGGSVDISPTDTTTYTGHIHYDHQGFSPQFDDTCTVTVTVTPAANPPANAPTCTLTASPAPWPSAGYFLAWTTSSSAAGFSLDHGIGSVSLAGVRAFVDPSVTTTYTGTVTDGSGVTGTCSTTVTIAGAGVPQPTPGCHTYTAADTQTIITGSVHGGNAVLNLPADACPMQVSFSSYSLPSGQVLPLSAQVLYDNITGTYGPGSHNIGTLQLPCNWQTDLYLGPVQPKVDVPPGTIANIAADFLQGQTCSAPPTTSAPTCNFTFNGSASASNVDPLASRTWAWSSTGGSTYSLKTVVTGCEDPSQNGIFDPWQPWISGGSGDISAGSNVAVPGSARYGCVAHSTYVVTNTAGQSATCNTDVAFKNSSGSSGPSCHTYTIGDVGRFITGSVQAGTAVLNVPADACPMQVSFSSYNLPDGQLLPFSHQVLYDNITDTYGPGSHNIGTLKLPCNWQTDLYFGPVQTTLTSLGTIGNIAADVLTGQTCSAPPAPVCSFTFNGATSASGVDPLASRTWAWSSLGGNTYNLKTVVSGCDDPTQNGLNDPWQPWINGGSGDISGGTNVGVPGATRYGCSAHSTYVVTNTAGQSVTCNTDVNFKHAPTPPPPHAPACTFTFNGATSAAGVDPLASRTWAWSSTNGSTYSLKTVVSGCTDPSQDGIFDPWQPWINGGSGDISGGLNTGIPGVGRYGCVAHSTYVVTSTTGLSATCSTDVIFTTPPANAPTCTLAANPTAIQSGDSSTLSWVTTNANSFTIDNNIGSVTPVALGSHSVSPTTDTTYTGTAVGNGGTVTCTATVSVTSSPPPPTLPTCTLVADPANVDSGDHTNLTWVTSNANAFSIDQGIGAVTPVNGGSITTPAITKATTYTGTVSDAAGHTAVCTANVGVNTHGGGGGPSCSLNVSPSSIRRGASATLSWDGTSVTSVDIDNGVGATTTIPSSLRVTPAKNGIYTYTGTFTTTSGSTIDCTAVLKVTSGGGGGGGGSPSTPSVILSSLPHIGQVLGSYLYLSQIPQTGLNLGPIGTTLYWLALIAWALALAYLLLFGAAPLVNRSLRAFGSRVMSGLNARELTPAYAAQVAYSAPAMVMPQPVPVMTEDVAPEAPRGYSTYDGFKSFANNGNGVLSIDDIVKSLSRNQAAPVAAPKPAPVVQNVEPIYENVEPVVAETLPELSQESVVEAPAHTRGFIAALVEGDRAAVFAGLRQHVRGGGTPEQLISPIAVMLDDVYRARVDGTACDAEIARLTARLSTPTLEKLVASLTNAIDSSYSTDATGAKLALTRALGILGA